MLDILWQKILLPRMHAMKLHVLSCNNMIPILENNISPSSNSRTPCLATFPHWNWKLLHVILMHGFPLALSYSFSFATSHSSSYVYVWILDIPFFVLSFLEGLPKLWIEFLISQLHITWPLRFESLTIALRCTCRILVHAPHPVFDCCCLESSSLPNVLPEIHWKITWSMMMIETSWSFY